MLQIITVVVRVVCAVFLVAAGVISGLLGVYFALNHNAHIFDGAPLLLIAGLVFAAAFFTAARNLIRAEEPEPTTT